MSLASLTVCLSVPGRPDLFAALLQPVTDGVNANFSHASGHLYVPVEVDACRSDPAAHPQPGGCMTQRAMTKLDEIGFLRALYAPAATADKDPACGPAVVAQLEVASGNVSAAAVESIMGDYCWPAGVGNASRPTVDEALAAAGSALAAKGLAMPPWHAINFRMPLDPCVTEPTYIFDAGPAAAWASGLVAVGVETRRVCQTPITAYRGGMPPVCTKDPTRRPVCWR